MARFTDFGVFAFASDKPKLPYQTVIATRYGNPSAPRRLVLSDLPVREQRLVHELSMILSEKITGMLLDIPTNEDLSIGPIEHAEGQNVPNHPHIVVAAAPPKRGVDMYIGETIEPEVAQGYADSLRLTPEEHARAAFRLGSVVLPTGGTKPKVLPRPLSDML